MYTDCLIECNCH